MREDIASDDENAVGEAASHIVRLANARGGEGFVAVSAEARKKFWLDRARTAAIAKHTNAFKINEDVVIPLPRLGDYSDGIERINIELSIANKLKLVDSIESFYAGHVKWYESYDDVKCHEALLDLSKEWADDGDCSNPYIGGAFARIGEEMEDMVEECWGQGDYDWIAIHRTMECDWMN